MLSLFFSKVLLLLVMQVYYNRPLFLNTFACRGLTISKKKTAVKNKLGCYSAFLGVLLLSSCSKHGLADAKLGMGCCGSKSDVVESQYEPLGASDRKSEKPDPIEPTAPDIALIDTGSTFSPSSSAANPSPSSQGLPLSTPQGTSGHVQSTVEPQKDPENDLTTGSEKSSLLSTTSNTESTSGAATSGNSVADEGNSQGSRLNATPPPSNYVNKGIKPGLTTPPDGQTVSGATFTRTTPKRTRSNNSAQTAPAKVKVPSRNAREEKNDGSSRKSTTTTGRLRSRVTYRQTSRLSTMGQDVECDDHSVGSSLASIAIPEDQRIELFFDKEIASKFSTNQTNDQFERGNREGESISIASNDDMSHFERISVGNSSRNSTRNTSQRSTSGSTTMNSEISMASNSDMSHFERISVGNSSRNSTRNTSQRSTSRSTAVNDEISMASNSDMSSFERISTSSEED